MLIFSQAIFAIPPEQKVLLSSMGRKWFVGAIFIMSAATYIAAYYIGRFIDFAKDLFHKRGGSGGGSATKESNTTGSTLGIPRPKWPSGAPGQDHSVHPPSEHSQEYSSKGESTEERFENNHGSQNRDPAHPKSIEEGKGPGITSHTERSRSLE